MKYFTILVLLFVSSGVFASEKINVKMPYVLAVQGGLENPEALIDSDPKTVATFNLGNFGLKVLLDLGAGYKIDFIRITNGKPGQTLFFLDDCQIAGNPPKGFGIEAPRLQEKMVKPLHRRINLIHGSGGFGVTEIHLPKGMVGRYVYLFINGGGEKVSLGEIEVYGTYNKPERHLLYWPNSYTDVSKGIDYLKEIGITDICLDFVETGFPQTNPNCGFPALDKDGVIKALKKAKIRYWLGEHEAFTTMVTSVNALRDDAKWETTLREMRKIYSKAKELGFTGVLYDAENYQGAIRPKSEFTDHFTSWSFQEEWGYGGEYYHRGYQVGKVISETLGPNFIQLYECRLYADRNDCRQGNYWWLKGMYDAGVTNIRIETEKTYGAGNNEFKIPELPSHLMYYFEYTDSEVERIWEAYPFISGVIPGYHPWNVRVKKPCYLPKYLKEQIEDAQRNAPAFWIYCEGNRLNGDPRKTLDREWCKQNGVTPEEYYDVLKNTK